MGPTVARRITDGDYRRLLELRATLRAFENWSAQRAAEEGLTPNQHQLLLAVRGHPGRSGPTIREVADYLVIRHNSAVELVDRVERLGLLERRPDETDLRAVRLRLTAEGRRRLTALSDLHLAELLRLAPAFEHLVEQIGGE